MAHLSGLGVAVPRVHDTAGAGIGFGADGSVSVGEAFRALDEAWAAGIAAMARAGARVIVDEVFLGGPASQDRWRRALVGVRCDPGVAAGRATARGDRVAGMAAAQAESVNQGVVYDLEVDDTHRVDGVRAAHRRPCVTHVTCATVTATEPPVLCFHGPMRTNIWNLGPLWSGRRAHHFDQSCRRG